MATMMKEKRREKRKKPKEKLSSSIPIESSAPIPVTSHEESQNSSATDHMIPPEITSVNTDANPAEIIDKMVASNKEPTLETSSRSNTFDTSAEEGPLDDLNAQLDRTNIADNEMKSSDCSHSSPEDSLAKNTSNEPSNKVQTQSTKLSQPEVCRPQEFVVKENLPSEYSIKEQIETEALLEDACPSAPIFDEPCQEQMLQPNIVHVARETRPKIQCMPLEEATRLFGGAEMADVRAVSEREEAQVEAGPLSGPEHPLVDLLSTFRCSLKAVERVRAEIVRGYREEEIYREKLWKVQKCHSQATATCECGITIKVNVSYEHAELMESQLPVAKMRLEALARDVQESYCHHQHLALLTHCQIEELLADTIEGSKPNIREALSLILKELRVADSAPPALAAALQRWARALAVALVDARDIRQLLFLLHHLFRQTRSVRWVARLVRVSASDSVEAARVIALLDLLLNRRRERVDSALECTEEADEAWEEVDLRGGCGAVTDGALRERDLLALFHALPTADLVKTLALLRHRDITQANEYEWGDASGGRGVLKSACGTRTLLATLTRAAAVHALYSRLVKALVELAVQAVSALADLHLHTRATYSRELEPQITAELEAAFAAAFHLLAYTRSSLLQLPFRMLSAPSAMTYCIGFIILLHEVETKPIEGADVDVPSALSCAERVRVIAHSTIDRTDDYELARNVLEFMFQTGLKPKASVCKGGCEEAARQSLPDILRAHPLLYPAAFHILADLHQADNMDESAVVALSPQQWRPSPQQAIMVLTDWEQRCAALLPALLLNLDYTPHVGIALETQVSIGSWVCERQRPLAEPAAWAWRLLRRLRTHRAWWAWPLDAPPPEREGGLLDDVFNLLATSWGHCVPVICSSGVSALERLSQAGRVREVVHCLAPLLLAMTQSPESVSMTEQFGTVISRVLQASPSLFQRALGLGAEPGAALLHKTIVRQLNDNTTQIPQSSIARVWLHALWGQGAAAAALLEAIALSSDPLQLDRAIEALQTESQEADPATRSLVSSSAASPMACACALRVAAARRARDAWPALLDRLHHQRLAAEKVHVDNALKHVGWSIGSCELAVQQAAAAAAAAPAQSPGHLALWTLFFQLYLQRPPSDMRNTTPPVGPLFFSGLIKSRTLAYLKRRLQEQAAFHQAEVARLKAEEKSMSLKPPPRTKNSKKSTTDVKDTVPLEDDLLKAEVLVSEVSDDTSDSDCDGADEVQQDGEVSPQLKMIQDLILYHCEAEYITKTYQTWLEEGEKCGASPHLLRPLSDRAYAAACKAELARTLPASTPDDEDEQLLPAGPLQLPAASTTPLQRVVKRLQDYSPKSKCSGARGSSISRPIAREASGSPRLLLAAVEKHLRELLELAHEWSVEVRQARGADAALWPLLAALRVRRPLPALTKRCANNCAPTHIPLQKDEWCVSPGAQRGIIENRSSARAAIRRLARPRPHAARTAAALHSIAREVREADTATRVLSRAWSCAADVTLHACAPARDAVTALVQHLAEKWISHDEARCTALLSAWGCGAGSALQWALAGALLQPRRLPPAARRRLYRALLPLPAPPPLAFSFASKFEVSRWTSEATREERTEVLNALTDAAQRHGAKPDESYSMLLELIGVHTGALLDAETLCSVCLSCARASAAVRLPPSHWTHVLRAADTCVDQVSFDELGHTLRSLGATWWAACEADSREPDSYEPYAALMARLVRTLLMAFVAAAHKLHYDADRVAYYSWCALLEAWSPWVSPARGAALLAADGRGLPYPAQQLRRLLVQLLQLCPGGEQTILHEVFTWVSGLFPHSKYPREQQARLASLLAELAHLPWREVDWLSWRVVPLLAQTCTMSDAAARSWSAQAAAGARAASWLRAASDDQLAPHLAAIFFVASELPLHQETIEELTQLPWWRLPLAALEAALERFFAEHHNVSTPYYDLPQFRLVLYASELSIHQSLNTFACRPAATDKRLSAVSLWVRAASAPALQAHLVRSNKCLLDAITDVAPCLANMEGEVEALLIRAVTILCTEPAGTLSLPVWQQWVSSAPLPLAGACLSAAATLTVLEHCAALADCAMIAFMRAPESPGWAEVTRRWSSCHWPSPVAMATRGRLHAAYASCLARAHSDTDLSALVRALATGTFDFIESESIMAVFACYLSGAARRQDGASTCARAVAALLADWATPKRRSLLKALTLQPDANMPTEKVRLLSLLSLCALSPSDASRRRAFTAACAAAALPADVSAAVSVPRLAARLYPHWELYFRPEMELTPEQ